MIAKGVKDALTTRVRKIHIFIGKGSPILAWTEIEHGNQTKFIINRQYPADHWLPIDGQLHTSRGQLRFAGLHRDIVFKSGRKFGGGAGRNDLDSGCVPDRPAVTEGTPYRPGQNGQARTLYG